MKSSLRRLVTAVIGKHEVWRIYSIETSECTEPRNSIEISELKDLEVFDHPDLEEDLSRANWYFAGAVGYAAWIGSKLAGVCWFWPGPLLSERNVGQQPDNCAELIQITVGKDWRGRGVGPALIQNAGWALRYRGYRRLYAQIWHSNTASMKAFTKCGWQQVGWFIQLSPRLLRRPVTLRWVLRRFKGSHDVLGNWKDATAERSSGRMLPEPILDWNEAAQSLKFNISDAAIGQFPFRALVSETPVTEMLGQEAPVQPPENLNASLAGAVIRNFPISKPLRTFQFQNGYLRYIPVRYQRYLIERSGSFDNYLEKFSSKSRKNLRRTVKKFEEAACEAFWREYRLPSEVADFHELAARISNRTYQSKLFDEGLRLDVRTRCHLDLLAANDAFRGYLLFLKGEPVAFALCERKGATLWYKTVGYAPEHRDLSPGTVLLWHIVSHFFNQQELRYLDFGEGADSYKSFFSNISIPCARVYYFRYRVLPLGAVLCHYLWNSILSIGHKLPLAKNFMNRFRKFLRRAVAQGDSTLTGTPDRGDLTSTSGLNH